jgi:molybdopterin-binding protein
MLAMASYRIGDAAAALGVSVDTLRRWVDAGRVPSSRSAVGQRLLDGPALAELARARSAPVPGGPSGHSARNRLPGVVTQVTRDGLLAQVELMCGPFRVVAVVTREAADELGLEPGVLAVASVKSTSVTLSCMP